MGKAMLIWMLALAGAGVSAIGAQPAENGIRCELKPETLDPRDRAIYWARQLLSPVPRPGEVKDVPDGLRKDCRYFLIDAAGTKITAVLTNGTDTRSALLYVDTNGDGRLSDEKGYKYELAKKGGWDRFGPVILQLGPEAQKTKVELGFMANGPASLIVHPLNAHLGEFRLGGSVYKIGVIDGDLDGAYGTLFSVPQTPGARPNCDLLLIDLNHDGKFPNWTYFQQSELMPLGKLVKLAGSYYGVDVARDGAALELKRVTPEFGTLDLGGADVQLKLWSDAAEQYLAGSEKLWQLPAGTYSALAVRLNQIDSSGARWTLYNYRETGALRHFVVRGNETTTLKLGAPFQIKTSAQRSGQTVSMGVLLEGQAGDLYSLAVTRTAKAGSGAKAPPAASLVAQPRFQIVNEAGRVLASGQFEYG